nr:MAG TPA: hypothetical protein [Caudoviricetes sp.]
MRILRDNHSIPKPCKTSVHSSIVLCAHLTKTLT